MKNLKNIYLSILMISLMISSGCTDLFEPSLRDIQSIEGLYENNPNPAYGLLQNAYLPLPRNSWQFSDMATDNAVSTNENHDYLRVATGQWTATFNPLNRWGLGTGLQYINLFLEHVDNIQFANDPVTNLTFRDRMKGEAYGLRALYMFHLLQAHAGMVNGELLGVPILTASQGIGSEFNIPRNTFEECMQQLYADVDAALELLPWDYQNINSVSDIPSKYRELGGGLTEYNRAFGSDGGLLVSGRIVRAVRAQAALLAASPAFAQGNSTTWADAANYAAQIIDRQGGVSGISPTGLTWYRNVNEINNTGGGNTPGGEVLWRTSLGGNSTNLEATHFPPTLFGNGLLNPTQNFVDAFPMANGYPIDHPSSGYDPNDPYNGRDPRLREFVIVNGSTAGVNNTVINTAADGPNNNALNRVETSTRTGYYLRKLLRQDVNLDPNSTTGQVHIQPRIRYTEIYLIYAEAANEAWGPTGTGSNGFSAYDVVRAIRQRAGIGNGSTDEYLESVRNDQVAMRELILNERRIELSFEDFRFWDLRRWNANLNETATGMEIQSGVHRIIDVENRVFGSHMIYGPIPYGETLKFSALQQNDQWLP
ncbi:RagB/SusD family nutrient uptake outer membrane protein [Belliella marina]|uniref:RagB/SusD family nutrient uptake outer membrane protein n=1 Tax=Belliella marina TaxID=1644146 RepID=A0ABW4VJ48_9BACT